MTTLTPDKQTWVDAHKGAAVEMALRGQIDHYTVLDDGRVAFHVLGGTTITDSGVLTFQPDGTEGTFIQTPPLSAEEVAAQVAAQEEAAAAEQAQRQEQAAAEAAARQAEIDDEVARELDRLGIERPGA